MKQLLLLVIHISYHYIAFVDGEKSEVCDNVLLVFNINLDPDGLAMCGVSPAPLEVTQQTRHHGECLAACSRYPGCLSYNYHYDSTKCELYCVPTDYAILPSCVNYMVRNLYIIEFVNANSD